MMDRKLSSPGLFSPKQRSLNSRKASIGGRRRTENSRGNTLSQVIYRSAHNVVETFGAPLPVLVQEALTFSDKSLSPSLKVSSDGWAWFVNGRRLLIWLCVGEDGRRRSVSSLCRELALPSSDLAYRADLVTVFNRQDSQVPSCIAASPEGLVRYWPSIAHEGASVEVNAELHGQECDSLTDVGEMGVILATTTASVILMTPNSSNSRPGLVIRPLRPPQGWLCGITRLIPSIIFGPLQSSQGMETKLVKVVAAGQASSCQLSLLAGHTLQHWLILQDQLQSLVYECNVTKIAVDAFQKTIWESSGGNQADIQVWLLDLQQVEGGVCVLMGGANLQVAPQFFYALGTLIVTAGRQPTRFHRFCPVKANVVYRESDEAELLNCKFVLHRNNALLYTRRRVFAISAVNFGEDVDSIDVISPMDEILGASLCGGVPVIFTKEHGLLSVSSAVSGGAASEINASASDLALVDSASASVQPDNVTFNLSNDDLDELKMSNNPVHKLEAAFLYYLRKNIKCAENILLPLNTVEEPGLIDLSCMATLAKNLAEAFPVGDPRWAAVKGGTVLGPVSLQINVQIEEKMRAMDAFVAFLKWSNLLDKYGSSSGKESVVAFRKLTLELREKLVALATLKKIHGCNNPILDQCISHVVSDEVPEGLTPVDIFYCRTSSAHTALQALTEWSEAAAHSDRRPQDNAAALFSANQILLEVLESVLVWRSQNCYNYLAFGLEQPTSEFLPWTATPGPSGLRDSLLLQHSLTLKYGLKFAGEASLRKKLWDQLFILVDILLDGWRTHVRSVKGTIKYDAVSQQFENTRQGLIKPFISNGEYEKATMLAEKYLDFHSLVQICDLTDNMERLDSYCNSFSEQHFAEFLFNWYIREGKPGHLLERFRSRAKPTQREQLCRFLEDHPRLSWVQDILRQDFARAHSTLQTVGAEEKDLLQRKKTIVSLSKLCLLASDESDQMVEDKLTDIDVDLNLIQVQEELPQSTLVGHGYDTEAMGVLSPQEIIKLYISDQNANPSESDYKKALDLLSLVQDDFERDQLKIAIWSSAILRDTWNDPEEDVRNKFFFKVVDLLEVIGSAVEDFLPPIDCLLECEELGELREDKQFQYLLRLGYEHFQKNES